MLQKTSCIHYDVLFLTRLSVSNTLIKRNSPTVNLRLRRGMLRLDVATNKKLLNRKLFLFCFLIDV